MDEAVAVVARALDVECCKVLELLPDGQAFLLRAGVGWKDGCVGLATVGAGRDSQAGYTLLSSEPVIVQDLRTETRFSGPPLLHDHGVVSGMSVRGTPPTEAGVPLRAARTRTPYIPGWTDPARACQLEILPHTAMDAGGALSMDD